jgi:hypothetical protein
MDHLKIDLPDSGVLVGGEATSERRPAPWPGVFRAPEDGGTLHLDPAGSNIRVTGSYSDPDCFPPGSQSNELFSYLIVGVLVTNPSLIVGEFPQGFEMPFTADGQRTEKSWPITVGRGSGTVTIEVWQLESDG